MTSTKSYAVCIKMCELFDQTDPTLKPFLSIGDLVQIHMAKYSDCDRRVIQLFNRKTQNFQSTWYQCEKDNLNEIPRNMWPFVQEIAEDTIVKVRMVLPCDQVIVNFQVKYFGEISSAGPGLFYGLQIMTTPNLTEENILELNKIYFNPTLGHIVLRADKFILNLEVNDKPNRSCPNTNRVEKTIYLSTPNTGAYDFRLVPANNICSHIDCKSPPASQDPTNIPKAIRKIIKNRTSKISDKSASTDSTQSNMRLFVLPKLTDNEYSSPTKAIIPRNTQRQTIQNHRACKNNCYDCNKNYETLLQFDCQHQFCSECLMKSLRDQNLEETYCLYKNQNYICRYKLTVDDIQNILDIAKGEFKNIFNKCTNCQFTSSTREQGIYQCKNCKFWNSVNIEEEAASEAIPLIKASPPPALPAQTEIWTCTYCTYGENIIDSVICVICGKVNAKFLCKPSRTEYDCLLELEETDKFIPNLNEFYCVFCDQTIAPKIGVKLRSCLHDVCHACIVSYIERQNQVEIKCPHTMCQHLLEEREIKTLVLPDIYTKRLELSLNIGKMNIANLFQCCAPGCDGFWEFVGANSKYNCPKCNIENCIECYASHPGIQCNVFMAQPK